MGQNRELILFQKPAITISEQIELLKRRGMLVKDEDSAKHILQYVGYYRFSGYSFSFRDTPEKFKLNTCFEEVYQCYLFDQALRALVFEGLEKIEIAIRSTLSQHLCEHYGPHWFLKSDLFLEKDSQSHQRKFLSQILEDIESAKTQSFIAHYYRTYKDPIFSPSWMIIEIISFGSWSHLYQSFAFNKDKNAIALMFEVNSSKIFTSWLRSLSFIRNTCAHHGRLWNRKFSIKPKPMKEMTQGEYLAGTFAENAFIIQCFLKQISPEQNWAEKLKKLLAEYPEILPISLGFNVNWFNDEHWQ